MMVNPYYNIVIKNRASRQHGLPILVRESIIIIPIIESPCITSKKITILIKN